MREAPWKRMGGAGYTAAGFSRYSNAGIAGQPKLRHVKNNSKPQHCESCGDEIPASAGMLGWMATEVKKAYGCSTEYKSVTKWYHIACCPEGDPRAPSSTPAADSQLVRDIKNAPPPKVTKKRARSVGEGGKAKAKKTEEFSEELLALSMGDLERLVGARLLVVYLKQHLGYLAVKKSGTQQEMLMRLITAMRARGITMKRQNADMSQDFRGTLYGPDGEKLFEAAHVPKVAR